MELAELRRRLSRACQQYLASRQGSVLVVPEGEPPLEEEEGVTKAEGDAAVESAAIVGGICRIAADAGRKPDIEDGVA